MSVTMEIFIETSGNGLVMGLVIRFHRAGGPGFGDIAARKKTRTTICTFNLNDPSWFKNLDNRSLAILASLLRVGKGMAMPGSLVLPMASNLGMQVNSLGTSVLLYSF